MSDIAIVENDPNLGRAYAEALDGSGHVVKIIGSDIEAMDYLVRQRKAPNVVILDMRKPGGAEMVVMGAVQRLSHLAHTKVLMITQEPGGQRAGQAWGADLTLPAPFSASTLKRAICALTAGPGSEARTGDAVPLRPTRVWWEGEEAVFIRWTDQSLVLAWPDAAETAVKIPRGAVTRLMGKGVLQIEGNVPAWVRLSRPEFAELEPVAALAHQGAARAASPASSDQRPDSVNQDQPALTAPPPAVGDRLNAPGNKLSVVARLIRKLTGNGDPQPQAGSSRALQGS
jgi:CheY-like chemotaxis protein